MHIILIIGGAILLLILINIFIRETNLHKLSLIPPKERFRVVLMKNYTIHNKFYDEIYVVEKYNGYWESYESFSVEGGCGIHYYFYDKEKDIAIKGMNELILDMERSRMTPTKEIIKPD